MKKAPDELTADVFQAELEMSVLEYGVVSAVVSGRTNRNALLVGDLFRADEPGRITGPGSGNRGIEWMSEVIPQSHPGRAGFYLRSNRWFR